jgi:hypothetical protein
MNAASDWKLFACVALGIAVMVLLPPPINSVFDTSTIFGVAIVGVRATLGAVVGIYGYLLLFDVPNAR